MAYDDLEVSLRRVCQGSYISSLPVLQTSQRDVLEAFSFSLGGHNTPQSYLDELWLALPTLRALLDFIDGWKDAQRETWKGLFEVILGMPSPTLPFSGPVCSLTRTEPDILCFPVSLLTICALISGITISLIDHYVAEAESLLWRQHRRRLRSKKEFKRSCHCSSVSAAGQAQEILQDEQTNKIYLNRAVKAAEGVVLDLRDLMDVDHVSTTTSDSCGLEDTLERVADLH